MEDNLIDYNDTNTIIFTSSRMNPPTPGHLLLIKTLIEEAIRKNVYRVYVILSKTNTDNKNPIDCNEKVNLLSDINNRNSMVNALKQYMMNETSNEDMKSKIQNVNVFFRCVRPEQMTPFNQITELINEYSNMNPGRENFLNLFLIIGDDRADTLDKITDSYLLKNKAVHSVNGLILKREDMGLYKNMSKTQMEMLNINSVPLDAFSASFIRNLVRFGLKDKFIEVYSPYLSTDVIERLYNEMIYGLSKPNPKNTESKVIPVKYNYPITKFSPYYNAILNSKQKKTGGNRTRKYKNKICTKKRKSGKKIKSYRRHKKHFVTKYL
jgi:nicotinic acid mononucleotide adenylyltransferase